MTNAQREIWQFVRDMNQTWTTDNRPARLKDYFHENMVAITPSDCERRLGRAECVAGWVQFCEKAEILTWQEVDPIIDVYGAGEFAVVTYMFEMSFKLNGRVIEMTGRDMFTLVKEHGRWWAVADQFSASPD